MQVISLTFFKRVADETNSVFSFYSILRLNIQTARASGGNQASWHCGGVSNQWLQAELLSWNTELNQLGFVDANGVVVSLCGMSKGVLEVPENTVLRFDGFFHVLADIVYSWLVEATTLNELPQSQLLLFQLGLEHT